GHSESFFPQMPPRIFLSSHPARRSVPLNGASPATAQRVSNDFAAALPTSGGPAIQVLVCNRLHAKLSDSYGQGSEPFSPRKGLNVHGPSVMNFSDLARQLKVSTATVSRALSRPEKVAPAT